MKSSKSFERFLSLLATIPDPRRAEGKIYKLPYILLFSILAVVSGANSYRSICTFIEMHRRRLNKAFKLEWKEAPAYTSIRFILQKLNALDVERAFREHASLLNEGADQPAVRALAMDGKVLRRSFDAMNDVRARRVLNAFATNTLLLLAHIEIDEKTNEIPAAQKLLEELNVADYIVTGDAIHCQKKRSKPPQKRRRT